MGEVAVQENMGEVAVQENMVQQVDIPKILLNTCDTMPVMGMGTATLSDGPDAIKSALLEAIKVGYRHFDTAALYRTEPILGEVIAEALQLGLIESRAELFITTKLWCNAAERHLVVPAIKTSLKKLGLDYVDLYLIHFPVKVNQEVPKSPFPAESIAEMDIKGVWEGMEECHSLGLAKAIGVSNFSSKKLEQVLSFAKVPPAVNQVEMNPIWQQKELNEFCKAKGILVSAFSPLGAAGTKWGSNRVMECSVLKDIAKAKGKTVAQVSLRWLHEQGVSIIVKSFRKERMKENLEIFDWSLSEDELSKIATIPQFKVGRFAVMMDEHSDIVAKMDAEN